MQLILNGMKRGSVCVPHYLTLLSIFLYINKFYILTTQQIKPISLKQGLFCFRIIRTYVVVVPGVD